MQSNLNPPVFPRHNLPLSQTSFIGREYAVNQVSCLLQRTRLLTITGSGGSGKTRLALWVAQTIARFGFQLADCGSDVETDSPNPQSTIDDAPFADGVWWVDLATLADPALVPQAIASALGLREQPGQSFTIQLGHYLRGRHTLLVLDNCEHLHQACAELLTALIADGCTAHVLATSREHLSVEGEQVWVMPMLALPDPQAELPVEELQEVEAIQLFVERARAVAPTFTLNERNAEVVTQICWRLDGLPLAIELAAARVNVLTPKQILERLADSMRLLTRGAHASESRHQTLRTALDWSFDLLTAVERAFFKRLATFAGSFILEAVEAICAGEGLEREGLLDLLASLVEKSLVVALEQSEGMRYRLLEPVRQYAVERLRAGGEESLWCGRHAAWYLALAERAEPALQSIDQKMWLDRLAQEYDNLRTALSWFATTDQVEAGLRLSSALFPFWRIRGYSSEGQRWLETFVERSAETISAATRINALNGLAWLHIEHSNFATSQTLFGQSLLFARQAGYDQGLEDALIGLGTGYWELGDYPTAADVIDEAVQVCRTTQHLALLARALRIRGMIYWSQGALAAARAACIESLLLARQTGNASSLAASLFNLAHFASLQGDFVEAHRLYEECLAVNRQLGDEAAIADVLINLGQLTVDLGDFVAATTHAQEAAQIHSKLGDQGATAYSLISLAEIAFYSGHYEQARTQSQAALTLFRAAGNKRMMGFALGGLGRIACREGDLAAAATFCAEALTLRQAIGHMAGVLFSLEEGYVELAVALGQPAVAARLLAVADGLYKEMSRTRTPIKERTVDQLRAKIHAQLGELALATAWGEGQAMGTELAIAYALDRLSPAAVTQPRRDLRFFALGPAHVISSERLLTSADWTYDKARELVFYLLCRPNATREEIGLEFWPDASTEQVRKRFSAALSHARNALGRATEWITLSDGRYRIDPARAYWFDVEVFESRLETAMRLLKNGGDQKTSREQAIPLLDEAVNLYQGDFVEDFLEGEWYRSRRTGLLQAYLDALMLLGEIHAEAGRYDQAIAVYQRALAKDPYLEEAHLGLIRCFVRHNKRGQALRQYDALTTALAELSAVPSLETQVLVQRLRRGESL